MIEFFVLGDPVPDQKRSAWVGDKPRRYSPKRLKAWRDVIGLASMPHTPDTPVDGPIRLSAVFFFARPKTHYINGDGVRLKDGAPEMHSLKHKDIDNLLKPVMDTLTSERWWHDDGQVCSIGDSCKAWSSVPGVAVRVERIADPTVPQWGLDLRESLGRKP